MGQMFKPLAISAARTVFCSSMAMVMGPTAAGFGVITTQIGPAPEFWYAEDYHQQYLHKNPNGYCGLGGTGVSCPVGVVVSR